MLNQQQLELTKSWRTAFIAMLLAVAVVFSPMIISAEGISLNPVNNSICSCFEPAGYGVNCSHIYCLELEGTLLWSTHGICGGYDGSCVMIGWTVPNDCTMFNWQYYCSEYVE